MKVIYDPTTDVYVIEGLLPCFLTIQALENHIKLMLIAVQNYKEKPVD